MSLLADLTSMCKKLKLPVATVLYTESPAPESYAVLTPLDEVFHLYRDNKPGIDVEEVRLSLFCTTNYRTLAKRITTACINAGLTVTARRYVGHEDDTGYHHWAIDVAAYELVTIGQ